MFCLVVLTRLGNGIVLPGLQYTMVFKPWSDLFTFHQPLQNTQAAELIDSYVQTGNSKTGSPSREHVFFNPVNGNNSALDNFFEALYHDAPNRLIRIAHYGDSQLEGDRISLQLRQKLQQTFGGSGYGFVPLADIAVPLAYERSATENLLKYNVFSQRLPGSAGYGLSGSAFKFVYQLKKSEKTLQDSSAQAEPEANSAAGEDSVRRSSGAASVLKFNRKNPFSSASLLFGRVTGSTLLNITGDNNKTLFTGVLSDTPEFTTQNVNRILLPAADMQSVLRLSISGDNSTIFTGLYLDSDKGIQVDNYSIRGHSGNGLLLLDDELIHLQNQYLDTKLVILQYGGNSVPYITGLKQKNYILDMYSSVIKKVRRILPQASILIVGVGDMAKAYDGEYRTYDGLTMVRDALKEVAAKNNCAFWDLYEMMGGQNSILVWAEKGLAAKDGHFTLKGEELVGNELAKQLIKEFELYKTRKALP